MRAMLGGWLVLCAMGAGCGTKPEPGPEPDGGNTEFVCWSQVEPLFTQRCGACHSGGSAQAGIRLDSYEAARANARRASSEIRSGGMPPDGPLAADEKKLVSDWVGSDTPQDCGPDGGLGDGSDGAPVVDCSTGAYWNAVEDEGELMRPGENCLGCHNGSAEAPTFTVAGTVMGAYHDVNHCLGIRGATVHIETESATYNLVTNGSGNFYRLSAQGIVATPYQARVIYQGHEHAMAASQTNRACMACHTRDGASDAPGRITIP